MHTNTLHTKLHARFNKTSYIAMGVLALYLVAPLTHAAPANNTKSPYRLNIKPIELPQVSEQPSVVAPTRSPLIYQLEFKYRSHKAPLKTKPEPPPPQSLTVRYLDSSEMQEKLADQPFSNEIARAAQAAALDPSLVHAVIYVESRYQHKAVSPKGAVGLMQVMPDTAARYGLRHAVYSPKENLKAGTLYLRDLMVMFDNRLDLVLAAYNAGENAVKKHARQIPPYPETRHYVKAVMARYASTSKYAYDIKYASTTKYPTDIKYASDSKPLLGKRIADSKLAASKLSEIKQADMKQAAVATYATPLADNNTPVNNKPEMNRTAESNNSASTAAELNTVKSDTAGSNVAGSNVTNTSVAGANASDANAAAVPNFSSASVAEQSVAHKPHAVEMPNAADINSADMNASVPDESDKVVPVRTQYLPGTGLVIANDDFTFKPEMSFNRPVY